MALPIDRRSAFILAGGGLLATSAAVLIPDLNPGSSPQSLAVDRKVTLSVGNHKIQYMTSAVEKRGEVLVLGERMLHSNALYRVDQNGEAYGPLISARFISTNSDLVNIAIEKASMPSRIHPMNNFENGQPGTKSFDGVVTVFSHEGDGIVETETYLLDQSPLLAHRFVRNLESGQISVDMTGVFNVRNGIVRPAGASRRIYLQTQRSGPFAALAEDYGITLPIQPTISPR